MKIVPNYPDNMDNPDKCNQCVNADDCNRIGKTKGMRDFCEAYIYE